MRKGKLIGFSLLLLLVVVAIATSFGYANLDRILKAAIRDTLRVGTP